MALFFHFATGMGIAFIAGSVLLTALSVAKSGHRKKTDTVNAPAERDTATVNLGRWLVAALVTRTRELQANEGLVSISLT